MAVTYQRRHAVVASAKVPIYWLKWSQWIPPFLIGFFALALLRSIGDIGQKPFGILPPEFWESIISFSGAVSIFFLTTAIAAVGLGTNLSKLKALGMESPLDRFLRRIYRGRSQLFLGNPTLLMGSGFRRLIPGILEYPFAESSVRVFESYLCRHRRQQLCNVLQRSPHRQSASHYGLRQR